MAPEAPVMPIASEPAVNYMVVIGLGAAGVSPLIPKSRSKQDDDGFTKITSMKSPKLGGN